MQQITAIPSYFGFKNCTDARTVKLLSSLLPSIWFSISMAWISFMTDLSQTGASVGSKEHPSPYEHNYARQINQHHRSLNEISNTLVLPPPSYERSYFSPRPKPNHQACAPLRNSCISRVWDRWGGCTLTCTMEWRQASVKVVPFLLQFFLASFT